MAERWLTALEQGLLARLIHQLEEDPPARAEPWMEVDASLLSSGWQKAIRRGDVEVATRCVASLHALDSAYVWRRLRGIALEEVSASDPELVGQVLAVACKQMQRRKVGDRLLALHLTSRLARAPKCRTACDLLMWQEPPFAVDWESVLRSAQERQPWTLASIALQARAWQSITARSIYRQGRWEVVSRADHARRQALLDIARCPALAEYLVRRGNGTDTLNALFVPAYQLAQDFAVLEEERNPHPDAGTQVGVLPAYAYCLFSAPGRAALRTMLREDPALARFCRRVPGIDALRAVGHVVFQREGSICRRVYRVALAREIRAASEAATLARYGVPATLQPELHVLVQAAWPRLLAARHAANAMPARRIRDRGCLLLDLHRSERP